MFKLIAVLAGVSLLTGCATVEKVPLATTVVTAMNGKTVTRTTRVAKPAFNALTPAKGALGMFGAVAAISAGNELVETNNVAVPADAIGQALGEQLQAVRGMRMAAVPLTVASKDAEQIAAAALNKADYVLDVETVNWMFVYFPTQWGRYKVIHTANARVIDVATRKVVAQGVCSRNPEFTENAPTYDQLIDQGAAGLKKELELAGTECINSLKRDILAL
jgi:hypothetical protein